jgi:phenylpropionate dioxygenase-like ring-hydroxylating dioxygenase large terminal subunit
MSTGTRHDVINMEKGTLDRRIFTDQDIYQEELEKVFGLAWLMVSHESLIPNPNDFFLSYMGEDPIIVTRDSKGEVHVFLNMCRHRGNRVVRADDGNAKNFMCTYHGWTFSNEGKLVSVPGLQEAYYGELDVENLSLVEARCDTYAGIIFACWADDAPSLEAYLGDARWYIDTNFNRRDCGMQAFGPQKWIEPCNWKTPVDNSSDNYHVPTTHFSSNLVQGRYGMRGGRPTNVIKDFFKSPNKHLFVNGHSLTLTIYDKENPIDQNQTSRGLGFTGSLTQQELASEVEKRLGQFRTNNFRLRNHSLFPNGVLGFRLALPRGPFKTEFWHFGFYEKDATPERIKEATTGSARGTGIAGLNEQDDMDNWKQVTLAGMTPKARSILQNLSMGMGHNGAQTGFPGDLAESFISENNQRHFYLRWQEFMNAKSWADIKIDPITAQFEGTATMSG